MDINTTAQRTVRVARVEVGGGMTDYYVIANPNRIRCIASPTDEGYFTAVGALGDDGYNEPRFEDGFWEANAGELVTWEWENR